MPGSDWDRMVAAPSDVEMASALAEVRVRAIGHSARAGRRRTMVSALALVAVAVVGAYAGRATAGLGAIAGSAGAPADPELLAVPADSAFAPGTVQRFHITSWSELDGVRMSESEGWVEGPPGTFFTVRNDFDQKTFSGTVRVSTFGDTTVLNVQVSTRTVLSKPRHDTEVIRQVRTGRSVRLVRGQSARFYPFGQTRRADEPLAVIRIDGPSAPPPKTPVRWQLPDTSRWDTGDDPPFMKRLARAHGVRFALRNVGPLQLRPGYTSPPRRFRFTLWGNLPSVAVSPQSEPFVIPGLADPVRLLTHRDRFGFLCFQVLPARAGSRALLAEGCWPDDATTGITRLEVSASQGQRLMVEGIAP